MTENQLCKRCGATISPDAASAVYCADCWTELTSNADLLDANPFAARNFSYESSESFDFDAENAADVPTDPISAFLMQNGRAFNERFEGRASRAEFWYWTLASLMFGWAPLVVCAVAAIVFGAGGFVFNLGLLAFAAFWAFETVPGLGVLARRLHDVGWSARSVWFVAVPWSAFVATLASLLILAFAITPFVEIFAPTGHFLLGLLAFAATALALPFFLIFAALPGTNGPNRFGPKPRRREKRKEIE